MHGVGDRAFHRRVVRIREVAGWLSTAPERYRDEFMTPASHALVLPSPATHAAVTPVQAGELEGSE